MNVTANDQNYQKLRQEVIDSGDVLTVSMVRLRAINGSGRLGPHVCRAISNELKSMGLAHYPLDLPESATEQVRLYRQGTPVARLIGAVLTLGDPMDNALREAVDQDSAAVLDQIRALVCD